MSIDYMLAKHLGVPDSSFANTVPMGSPDEIRGQIALTFPGTNWCNHERANSVGILWNAHESIEFCLTYEKMLVDWAQIAAERRLPTDEEVSQAHLGHGQVMTIAVHFRRGSGFIPRLRALCDKHGWTVWDMQTGQVFNLVQEYEHENHVEKIGNMIDRLQHDHHSNP